MSDQSITIADIFALFQESERQREAYQAAFDERQREYEAKRLAEQAEQKRLAEERQREHEQRQREHEQRLREYEERQREYEAKRLAEQTEYEAKRLAEQAEQKRLAEERQREYEERQREYEERQRKHDEEMAEFRKSMEETRKMVAQTNKQMGAITSRWGEFVEGLVRPAAVRLFREQGIAVHYTFLRAESHDYRGSVEIDIWVENSNEIVAIEVKSHLKVRHIKRFVEVLDRFKDVFSKYANYRVYGAVAGIKIDEKADQYALEQGLFLIRPSGDSVTIDTRQGFEPKAW